MPGQQSMMPGQKPIPPQEIIQPPQVPPQPANVEVNILLVGGINVKLPMVGTNLQPFLQEVSNAIDSQASIQIGNQLINGRNIVIVQW